MTEQVRKWHPISTAPKDGSWVLARGHNWGDRTRGRHMRTAYWDGKVWRDARDEDLSLHYLEEWRPFLAQAVDHQSAGAASAAVSEADGPQSR